MKVLLIGAGVMSEYLITSIKEKGYEFIGRVDLFGNGEFDSFSSVDKDFDVIIDFSNHLLTKDVLNFAMNKKKNVLIATTGQTDEEMEIIKEASEKIAILKSTNTSFGVNALNKIVEYATKILNEFDIELVEAHHNRKVDAPSGTAETLLDIIDESLGEKRDRVYGRRNEKREKKEIGVHSIRGGNIVGEHNVIYSKGDEIIEIKHSALSRKIFSDGAVNIVEKLVKLENGLFNMKDVM
ncbi:4-hydroxy-tetrahydrodipicolinate reductase [Streptobacillus felis]|uniref:4-hydroxy-tetrahydrodipicolinate reductase n=1 Tax=Streptobacillus felis TaxID=1384509 RepID=A0A7Z0TBF8_9FUSO|nr:4-hydroxy-tetrahydrodipicolinate reductase [Streptobacillus felis]NYV27323.1 4-hydroxy-tetrahydrodipicolinate reductase [Streptobacillus felis]